MSSAAIKTLTDNLMMINYLMTFLIWRSDCLIIVKNLNCRALDQNAYHQKCRKQTILGVSSNYISAALKAEKLKRNRRKL